MPARIEGVQELRRSLLSASKRVDDESGRALVPEAEALKKKAQARTPVDTGALRDSFEVSRPKQSRGVVSVEVRAGGPSAPYAAKVHENMEASHAKGEAKFLQRPTLEARGRLLRALAGRFSLRRVVR